MNILNDKKGVIDPEYTEIEALKKEFINYIINENNSIERIMNKYLLFGVPYIYKNKPQNTNDIFIRKKTQS